MVWEQQLVAVWPLLTPWLTLNQEDASCRCCPPVEMSIFYFVSVILYFSDVLVVDWEVRLTASQKTKVLRKQVVKPLHRISSVREVLMQERDCYTGEHKNFKNRFRNRFWNFPDPVRWSVSSVNHSIRTSLLYNSSQLI